MAVYKRNYKAWTGRLTPEWSRFLILTRYAWNYIFRSRFMAIYLIVCLIPPLIMGLGLYLNHSDSLLKAFHLPAGRILITDIPKYLKDFLQIELGFATLLVAFAAPAMISPDLGNNALPLYFCRPFSRMEYILGKFCVIAWLVTIVSAIPGLILFGIEAGLSGATWTWDNLWLAGAITVGSLAEVVALSLLGLALSAWVKWKPIAGALVLGVFFLGAGFGAAINAVAHTTAGDYINLGYVLDVLWTKLFRYKEEMAIPLAGAAIQLCALCGFCLFLLHRKTRAFEVIR